MVRFDKDLQSKKPSLANTSPTIASLSLEQDQSSVRGHRLRDRRKTSLTRPATTVEQSAKTKPLVSSWSTTKNRSAPPTRSLKWRHGEAVQYCHTGNGIFRPCHIQIDLESKFQHDSISHVGAKNQNGYLVHVVNSTPVTEPSSPLVMRYDPSCTVCTTTSPPRQEQGPHHMYHGHHTAYKLQQKDLKFKVGQPIHYHLNSPQTEKCHNRNCSKRKKNACVVWYSQDSVVVQNSSFPCPGPTQASNSGWHSNGPE
jgi:hypothetical protein